MVRIQRFLPVLAYVLAALGFLVVPGCGPSRENIKGTVVFPPAAPPKEGDAVTISFVPEERGGTVGYGTFSAADRSFVVKGSSDGRSGIPPGKYKITVQASPYPGPDADQRQAAWQNLNNAYNTDNSKLNHEATGSGTQTITIDLTKGTVTKK